MCEDASLTPPEHNWKVLQNQQMSMAKLQSIQALARPKQYHQHISTKVSCPLDHHSISCNHQLQVSSMYSSPRLVKTSNMFLHNGQTEHVSAHSLPNPPIEQQRFISTSISRSKLTLIPDGLRSPSEPDERFAILDTSCNLCRSKRFAQQESLKKSRLICIGTSYKSSHHARQDLPAP
jgi:hypothetical protein